MLERDQLIEIAVAVTVVLLMLAAMITIGSTYGAEDSSLTPEGGQMLVGAIVGFIVLLTAVGFGFAYYMNDPDEGLETDDDADARNAA